MNILSIGTDTKLFDPTSQASKRIIKYGELVNHLHLVVYSLKGFAIIKLSDHVTIYPTNSSSKFLYPLNACSVSKKVIKENKIDLISAQDPFETALIGTKLSKKFKLKLQIQIHGNFFGTEYWKKKDILFKLRIFFAPYFFKRADNIRVVSIQIKESLNKFNLDQDKIDVLPIFFNYKALTNQEITENIREKYQGKKILLTISRLTPEKNLDRVIKVFSRLNNELNDTLLFIVGEGSEKAKLQALSHELGMESKVIFFGWREDIHNFLKIADLFILFSETEGYNRSVVEAMSCLCPVIMTNVGPAGDLVINNENGLIIDLDDNKLLEAIKFLLSNHELREQLIKKGLDSVNSLPSEEEY